MRPLSRIGVLGWCSARRLRWGALLPGALLCCVIAMAAAYTGLVQGGPPMLIALAFGALFHFQSHDGRTEPGVSFCMRGVLRLGIGLLGARIGAEQIVGLGWPTVGITVAAVATTVLCGVAVARWLKLSKAIGLLAGGACGVCGAAAALAVAAVLPPHPDKHRHTLAVVVMATVCSTAATLLYPLLARSLGLADAEAGLFIGGTLHDVAQVVVAGYALGHAAGDTATVVKLLRVSLLTLVVVSVALAMRREGAKPSAQPAGIGRFVPPIPWFLWLFAALVALHSTGTVGPRLQQALVDASTASLMVGVTALGMNTSFSGLRGVGWRPVVLMLACSAWIAVFVLAAIGVARHLF